MGDDCCSNETNNTQKCVSSTVHLQISHDNSRVSFISRASSNSSTIIELNESKSKPENENCFTYILKLRSRVIWVLVMIGLGTIYTLGNVMNYIQLTKVSLRYELVIGPPPQGMVIALTVFTLLGIILYVCEIVNTLSVFFRSGQTLLSLTLEMVITIILVHVPVVALNYFIARCRAMHISMWQVLSGVLSIVFISVRVIWFAHMQGKKLKINDKREIKQGPFMAVCALFSCGIAFQIMLWRSVTVSELTEGHTHNVTIMLLEIPHHKNNKLEDYNLTNQIPDFPALHNIKLQDIVNASKHGNKLGISVMYDCPHGTNQLMPLECMQANIGEGSFPIGLLFHFMHHNDKGEASYGEIIYNYAKIYENMYYNNEDRRFVGENNPNHLKRDMSNSSYISNTSILNTDKPENNLTLSGILGIYSYNSNITSTNIKCEPSDTDLKGQWKFWYTTKKLNENKDMLVSSPWCDTCSTPHPRYSQGLAVCSM